MFNDQPKNLDPCPICRRGGSIKPSAKSFERISLTKTYDQECYKCGAPLYSECKNCNGTGIKIDMLLPLEIRLKGICECGREVDDKCRMCNGEGEVFDFNHDLHCPNP